MQLTYSELAAVDAIRLASVFDCHYKSVLSCMLHIAFEDGSFPCSELISD
jgi:hypothetical protein